MHVVADAERAQAERAKENAEAERYNRVIEIVQEMMDLPPDEWEGRLEAARCDAATRREVESLLGHASRPRLLATIGEESPLAAELAELAHEPPSRIGRYRILRLLAEGGTAVVYEGRRLDDDQPAAIKVFRGAIASSRWLRRFRAEIEILRTLRHPALTPVYESGSEASPFGTLTYFAMELVEGEGVADFVRAHERRRDVVLRLLVELCEAVQFAHDHGVIHRDLKPANLMVHHSGALRVLDFGVARALGADLSVTRVRTETGQLVGTVSYMSPEQVRGERAAVDHRADIYAIGVLAFELLTGRLPYDVDRRRLLDAMGTIRDQAPRPLRELRPEAGGQLEAVIARALEKQPSERQASAGELAAELRACLEARECAAA
jgi:serine/threonine protein kinase